MSVVLGALLLFAQTDSPVVAQIGLEPREAEIGQPLTLVFTATHPPGFELDLPSEEALVPDDTWVLLDSAPKLTTKHPEIDDALLTIARWELSSLEPGERVLEVPAVRWSDGSRAGFAEFEPVAVTIGHALAEGEDAPRPGRGFRDPVFEDAPLSNLPIYLIAGFVLFMGLILWRASRGSDRQKAPRGQVTLRPRAALEALEYESEPSAIRASYFELSRLLRGVVDERDDAEHSGLTDEEWLTRVKEHGRLSKEDVEALAGILEKCEQVKYAQAEPTQWALDEALQSARDLAGRIEGQEAPE